MTAARCRCHCCTACPSLGGWRYSLRPQFAVPLALPHVRGEPRHAGSCTRPSAAGSAAAVGDQVLRGPLS